jgi:alkyl hydroperoxide reductase subunit AhpC
MAIKIGQEVPLFGGKAVAPNGEFIEVRSSDYKGKWLVVFFYPLDFTFVCPTEIREFDAQYPRFRELGAEVLGVSTDSVYSHKAWCEQGLGRITFPLLSDVNHSISRTFDVLLEDQGIALRGTFIIDPQGKLRSIVVNDLPVGRSIEETLRTLQALQTGELVQCGWKPGQATLSKKR